MDSGGRHASGARQGPVRGRSGNPHPFNINRHYIVLNPPQREELKVADKKQVQILGSLSGNKF